MDDLLDNFASSGLESPDDGDYKYHFVNDSPVGSEHTRPVALISTASPERSPKATTREKDYEGDIDDDDDDEDYYEREDHGAYPDSSINGTAQREVLQLEIGTVNEGLDDFASQLRHLHRQDIERDVLLKVGYPPSFCRLRWPLNLLNRNSIEKIRT